MKDGLSEPMSPPGTAPLTGAPGSSAARSMAQGIGLYVHIPFCQTKCPYCDFNTYAGIERLMPSYLEALATELRLWGSFLRRPPVNTVFLGGGTPSLLTPPQLASLLAAVEDAFRLRPGAEVTAEVNPDDVSVQRMSAFLSLGVNRVSMGVQSLDPGLLQVLGRRHSAGQAVASCRLLREAGFENVNLDLMYGLPFQDLSQWQSTLTGALALEPEHLSAYCLTLEGGTPMERQVRAGSLPDPDPDLAADMYEWAQDLLASRGYVGYEISNWARPGLESRHNLTYWRNLPYLGVGPGAHSYLGGCRFAHCTQPADYINRVAQWADRGAVPGEGEDAAAFGAIPTVAAVETIDRQTEMAETLMMGLRLEEGVSFAGFADRFGLGLLEVYPGVVDDITSLGLAEVTGDAAACRLRLTPRGRLLGNQVFYRFAVPEPSSYN